MTSVMLKAAAALALVLCSCLAVVPLVGESDADGAEDTIWNGETVTINKLEVTGLTCGLPTAPFPEIISADVPQWVHYITPANQRIFIYCIPTETGSFPVSFTYYESEGSSEVKTWSCTLEVVDPYKVEDPDVDSPLDSVVVDVTYRYNGDQLIIYFDGIDTSSVVEPYFYIAVFTGDSESCRYYLSPGYNESYTVNRLDDSLEKFIVYLCDGLPGDFSASTIVSSALCLGSKVVEPVEKESGSGSEDPETPSDDVTGSDVVPDDPSTVLSYGIVAIAALFAVAVIFGRRR